MSHGFYTGDACNSKCPCMNDTFFCTTQDISLGVASVPSRSLLRVTPGVRVYTTARMRAPTEVRGACYGPSKTRNLASNHGEAFCSTRAKQD